MINAQTHGQPAKGPVEVRVCEENGSVTLTVADRGPGIGEQDLPHVTEPFCRADKSRSRERSGFGLGLSMCKTIVAAHGGALALTSRLGIGTEVTVRLPAAKPGRPDARTGDAGTAAAASRGSRE